MAGTKNDPELDSTTLELARGANFAAITTIMPDGDLQNHYIWAGTDGERLFVNTEIHRQKFKNVERNPRVTLTIRDEPDPYRYAEVRGEVVETVRGQEARNHMTNSPKSATVSHIRRIRYIRRIRTRPRGQRCGLSLHGRLP